MFLIYMCVSFCFNSSGKWPKTFLLDRYLQERDERQGGLQNICHDGTREIKEFPGTKSKWDLRPRHNQ